METNITAADLTASTLTALRAAADAAGDDLTTSQCDAVLARLESGEPLSDDARDVRGILWMLRNARAQAGS